MERFRFILSQPGGCALKRQKKRDTRMEPLLSSSRLRRPTKLECSCHCLPIVLLQCKKETRWNPLSSHRHEGIRKWFYPRTWNETHWNFRCFQSESLCVNCPQFWSLFPFNLIPLEPLPLTTLPSHSTLLPLQPHPSFVSPLSTLYLFLQFFFLFFGPTHRRDRVGAPRLILVRQTHKNASDLLSGCQKPPFGISFFEAKKKNIRR